MSHGKFATAINCMDGRTQLPVIEWVKKKYSVDYVDTITEPGPDKILAENTDTVKVESIKNRVEISVNKHHSKFIALVAHHDCAGNPVEKEKHFEHIKKALETINSWGYAVEIVGLWVEPDNDIWKVSSPIYPSS